jgi:hypothetical protein
MGAQENKAVIRRWMHEVPAQANVNFSAIHAALTASQNRYPGPVEGDAQ